MRSTSRRLGVLALSLSCAMLAFACSSSTSKRPAQSAQTTLGPFPAAKDPKVIGKRLAVNLTTRPAIEIRRNGMIYPEVCTAYGSLRFARATGDTQLRDTLIKRYDDILNPDGKLKDGRRIVPDPNHVDYVVFAAVPLEIYKQTKDERYLSLGKRIVDVQWDKTTPDGITAQARYWIDDMFMIPAAQLQAYRVTGDRKYLDHTAKTMVAYLDRLQQPNGLFYHSPESKFYWGRGDGWVAVGMAELLLDLPKDHPDRPRVMQGYKTMMAALLKHQAPSGMWRQLIDVPQSWEETSSTGMFTFALATGVKHGWLDAATYRQPARKAWLALCDHIDPEGKVRDVCIGTNKGPTTQYYLDRERKTADLHGQAASVWAAWAMLD